MPFKNINLNIVFVLGNQQHISIPQVIQNNVITEPTEECALSKPQIMKLHKNLDIIEGKGGKQYLMLDGYKFMMKMSLGTNTKYWSCRHRSTPESKPCESRCTSIQKDTDLYKIIMNGINHNHEPSNPPVPQSVKDIN